MPKDENIHVNATPHFDGEGDRIINDPTSTASNKLGVFTPPQSNVEFGMERNPFKFTPKVDPMMQRFEKLMRGNRKE